MMNGARSSPACSLRSPPPVPTQTRQLPSAPPPADAAASGTSRELLRELRRENVELQRLRQELESTQQQQRQQPAAAAAPAAAPASPSSAAPTAPAAAPAAAEEEEEGGGGAMGALNLVGILAAGGLGGYLTIQRREAEAAESAFQTQLASEQGTVDGLRSQLGEVQGAMAREQELGERLRKEAMSAAASAQRQVGGGGGVHKRAGGRCMGWPPDHGARPHLPTHQPPTCPPIHPAHPPTHPHPPAHPSTHQPSPTHPLVHPD